jgi:hypothetical protein
MGREERECNAKIVGCTMQLLPLICMGRKAEAELLACLSKSVKTTVFKLMFEETGTK